MYRLLLVLALVMIVLANDAARRPQTSGARQEKFARKQQQQQSGTGSARGVRQGATSSLVPNNGSIVATSSEINLPSTGTFSSIDTNKAIITGVLSVGLLTICFLGLAVLVCYVSWKTGSATPAGPGLPQPSTFTQDSPLFKPLITTNDNPLFESKSTL